MFKDRREAGRKLAEKLEAYRGENGLILALPRGGVVLGHEIAHALSMPLDIITTRKIGHPSNPEYAIGAVDQDGVTILNESEIASVDKEWLRDEVEKQKAEAVRRNDLYRKQSRALEVGDKIIIIVDDGIATGFTMRLAVKVIKNRNPKRVIVAVPVASQETIQRLKKEGADEIIVLEPPEEFMGAVGAHYQQFDQVDDEEVINLLNL